MKLQRLRHLASCSIKSILDKNFVSWNKVFKENKYCTPHSIYLNDGFWQAGLVWNCWIFNLSTSKDTLQFSVRSSQASTELSKTQFFPVSIVKSFIKYKLILFVQFLFGVSQPEELDKRLWHYAWHLN